MTIAYWSILVAAFLPYIWALSWRVQNYDRQANLAPRRVQEKLFGWRQRAHWAHLNGLESFAPFAAAVIIAHQRGAPQALINSLAVAFIAFRIAHGVFYISNLGVLRTLAFFGGIGCMVAIFLSAI